MYPYPQPHRAHYPTPPPSPYQVQPRQPSSLNKAQIKGYIIRAIETLRDKIKRTGKNIDSDSTYVIKSGGRKSEPTEIKLIINMNYKKHAEQIKNYIATVLLGNRSRSTKNMRVLEKSMGSRVVYRVIVERVTVRTLILNRYDENSRKLKAYNDCKKKRGNISASRNKSKRVKRRRQLPRKKNTRSTRSSSASGQIGQELNYNDIPHIDEIINAINAPLVGQEIRINTTDSARVKEVIGQVLNLFASKLLFNKFHSIGASNRSPIYTRAGVCIIVDKDIIQWFKNNRSTNTLLEGLKSQLFKSMPESNRGSSSRQTTQTQQMYQYPLSYDSPVNQFSSIVNPSPISPMPSSYQSFPGQHAITPYGSSASRMQQYSGELSARNFVGMLMSTMDRAQQQSVYQQRQFAGWHNQSIEMHQQLLQQQAEQHQKHMEIQQKQMEVLSQLANKISGKAGNTEVNQQMPAATTSTTTTTSTTRSRRHSPLNLFTQTSSQPQSSSTATPTQNRQHGSASDTEDNQRTPSATASITTTTSLRQSPLTFFVDAPRQDQRSSSGRPTATPPRTPEENVQFTS